MAFYGPEAWDERRANVRERYARQYGVEPPEQSEIDEETVEGNQARYARIRDGFEQLRTQVDALQPDTIVLIGDDQGENYREDNLPQFAIYVGDELVAGRGESSPRYRCDTALARAILREGVEAGFDLASSRRFPNDALISHAHVQVMHFLDPEARIPVVPIFINAIHVPAPTPRRCLELGRLLHTIIEAQPDDKRVLLYASGGLSHFTSGYPWLHYEGPHTLGWISVDFDRRVVETIAAGRGAELGQLSSKDLLDNGDIEMRQWITLIGATGDRKPNHIVYEPFFRGLMGMATASWDFATADRSGVATA
jgi:aromatic ring-opening dioxygenase catalytic subunit (LigB family)